MAYLTVYYSGNWESLIIYTDDLGVENPSKNPDNYYSIKESAEILRYSATEILKQIESGQLQAYERCLLKNGIGQEYYRYILVPDQYITRMLLYPGKPYVYEAFREEDGDGDCDQCDDCTKCDQFDECGERGWFDDGGRGNNRFDKWLASGEISFEEGEGENRASESLPESRFVIISEIAVELGLDLHQLKMGQKRKIEDICRERNLLTADTFKTAWQAARDNGLIG